MTLLTTKEAALYLRYTNPKSLYNNKRIPRHAKNGRVYFVKEELDQWILGSEGEAPVADTAHAYRPYKIKVHQ
jgi:hypothetical protein